MILSVLCGWEKIGKIFSVNVKEKIQVISNGYLMNMSHVYVLVVVKMFL